MTDYDENMVAEGQHREMSRRRFLAGTERTLAMALASAGVFYEFIDQLAQKNEQVAFADGQPLPQEQDIVPLPQEQYLVPSTQIVNVNSSGLSASGPGTRRILPPVIFLVWRPYRARLINGPMGISNTELPCTSRTSLKI